MRLPLEFNGAGGRIRTADLLITNQLLYQLSYASAARILTGMGRRGGIRVLVEQPPDSA